MKAPGASQIPAFVADRLNALSDALALGLVHHQMAIRMLSLHRIRLTTTSERNDTACSKSGEVS